MIISISVDHSPRFIPIIKIATVEAPELAERRALARAWLGSRWILDRSQQVARRGPYELHYSRLELFARGRRLMRALGWPVDIKPKPISWEAKP